MDIPHTGKYFKITLRTIQNFYQEHAVHFVKTSKKFNFKALEFHEFKIIVIFSAFTVQ